MKMKKAKTLEELTETWKAMERKTFIQRERAEMYYEKNLMPPIVEQYCEQNADMVFEKVDYLILSVGTSYEPLVLNIALLQPERILFLYTEESENILNKIVGFLRLEVTSYQKCIVEPTDSLSIYQEIKRAYISWGRPQKVYIDFTGGTKTMSAAAALAGSLINVQLVYVGTEHYLTDFRKPEPGDCYPSPVLHALKKSEESGQVTMPMSRKLTANQQQVLKQEINAAAAVTAIAEKMMELRRQRRGLDKSLGKCEQELGKIFDDNHTDQMEIKLGLLVRRRRESKIEWVIEL